MALAMRPRWENFEKMFKSEDVTERKKAVEELKNILSNTSFPPTKMDKEKGAKLLEEVAKNDKDEMVRRLAYDAAKKLRSG